MVPTSIIQRIRHLAAVELADYLKELRKPNRSEAVVFESFGQYLAYKETLKLIAPRRRRRRVI